MYDADNLALAFLTAGVPQVVASRWDVDSAATATLMRAFYQHYVAGGSAAHALQAAAGKLRASPATGHPYYWAAFDAFGRN